MRRRSDRKLESIGDARMQRPPDATAASRAPLSAGPRLRRSSAGRRTRRLVRVASVLLVAGMTGCASDGDEIADTTETTSTTTTSTTTSTTTTSTTSTTAPTTTTAEVEPWTYGDDPTMDALWDRCEAGDAAACDELYQVSPVGSEYETFGFTCGGRTDGGGCDIDTTDELPPPPEGTGGDLDALCETAAAEIAEVPTGGLDTSDFALEESAVAQILYGLADELAAAGAGDLSGAVQAYADARSDLALAYDQGGLDEADAAQAAVDTAAQGVVDAASAANAPACEDIAG